MGEGILLYGLSVHKRHYYRDLQSFTTDVIKRKRTNNSRYIFGRASKAILQDLNRRGIKLHTPNVAITDKTIMKYLSHPKKQKGAVVSFNRWRMVEKAVNTPKTCTLTHTANASCMYAPQNTAQVKS